MYSFLNCRSAASVVFLCDVHVYTFASHDDNLYNTYGESLLIFFHLNYMYVRTHTVLDHAVLVAITDGVLNSEL